jgi:hypothetical protein
MRTGFWPIAFLVSACTQGTTTPLDPKDSGAGGATDAAADSGVEPPDTGVSAPDGGVDPDTDGGAPRYTWWQDVEPIVRDRCQLCHQNPPQFGAPRPFVEYQDTQVLIGTAPVHQVMVFRIFADQNRMPPSTQPQLSDEEKTIIRIWSEIGAPEGIRPIDPPDGGTTSEDGGTPPADAGVPLDAGTPTRPISRMFELRATEPNSTDPYVLPVTNTNYVCWSFTVPQGMAAGEYAFRYEPLLDNTANTHHMLLFHDAGGGNDPGPFGCEGFPLDWNMIAGWAPGRGADEIPAGAGVPIAAGEQIVLQVHYDGVNSAGTTDNSGIRMVLTDETGLEPAGVVWAGVVWASSINGSSVTRTNTCELNEAVTMFTVFPHMHRLGTRITLEVQRGGSGPWATLVDISGWSFEDQPNVPIAATEQAMMPGDRLRTTCWWDTQGQSVNFGEASSDEMCFNFIYHYPKINFDYACVGYQP